MDASCCVARKIFLSPAMASSNARTLDSRPTTNGVIMNGKMTTSRMGIIGRRFVSDFSLEVNIVLPRGECVFPGPGCGQWLVAGVPRQFLLYQEGAQPHPP